MNRSRSNDSLDNGLNDVATSTTSSSSMDFTSDDEAPPCPSDEFFRVFSHQYVQKRYTPAEILELSKKFKDPLEQRKFLDLANLPDEDFLPPGNSLKDALLRKMVASTSYYNKKDSNSDDIDLHPSIPDIVPGSIPNSMLSQIFNTQLYRDRYGSKTPQDSEIANNGAMSNLTDYNVNDNDIYLGENRDMDQAFPFLAGPSSSRGLNPIACRLCAKLVECTTLSEAIEFINNNRDLIDAHTRIVTKDQPAFRDYDMSNYHIDSSVKESFNPNFWLDREPVITTADGNCQYHAVSISLTGSEWYTQEVRLATAVAVVDNRDWFDSMLKLIDRGTVIDLVHTIARSYSWGDETTLKAIAVAINRRIFLYTCNRGKNDYEMVMSLSKEELLDAFKEKKYRGGTGIHAYADPLIPVAENNYIMLFHKSEHFIAVLPTNKQPTMFEPYNPIVPTFS